MRISQVLLIIPLCLPPLNAGMATSLLIDKTNRTAQFPIIRAGVDPSKAGFRKCKQKCARKHYCQDKDRLEKNACIDRKKACIAACK
ncbi:MAG: hypothetical protein KDJ45_07385 [Hyphomicrobiaceae bacterium]|nr:hypothetical protein [Hyphomicrobiaceae bacterium]